MLYAIILIMKCNAIFFKTGNLFTDLEIVWINIYWMQSCLQSNACYRRNRGERRRSNIIAYFGDRKICYVPSYIFILKIYSNKKLSSQKIYLHFKTVSCIAFLFLNVYHIRKHLISLKIHNHSSIYFFKNKLQNVVDK